MTKFLKDQGKTPKTNMPTCLKIQQIEGDVTSLNVDDLSFTIIIDHPCFDIAPMQANVLADQPYVGDNSTQRAAGFPEIDHMSFLEIVQIILPLYSPRSFRDCALW